MPNEVQKSLVINHPEAVAIASNKLKYFTCADGKVNIPPYTTDKEEAKEWSDEGKTVVVREKLTGHSAEGIVILEDEVAFGNYPHNNAKLYVKYIPKKEEYRVHVFCGKVIDVRRKALKKDTPAEFVDWKIRNHKSGFIYAKEDVAPDEQVLEQSLLAVAACGLDFGAVDVMWNEFNKKAWVLEVNTSPGLEGSTIDSYKKAIEEVYEELKGRVNPLFSLRKCKSISIVGAELFMDELDYEDNEECEEEEF
jgi:glutathione synthase/RimK-type ligase-like ATP-grasp enzyme